MKKDHYPAAALASAAALTTIYETNFGTGVLFWQGPLLVRHLLPREYPEPGSPGRRLSGSTDGPHEKIRQSLESYFAGNRVEFPAGSLPIDWSVWTPFGQKVARALASISFGETASYAELAAAAGRPRASRAVGNFVAANPFPLLLPCHRIIRSDGGPGGFSGGRHWKQRLLQIEGVDLRRAPFRSAGPSNKL